jgi:hypothetical protein
MLLSASLILQGCHSYYTRDESARRDLRSLESERIALQLKDGTSVESEALQHLEVAAPSHLVYGKGRFAKRGSVRDSVGVGILQWSAIDSSRVLPQREGESLRCWLANGDIVTFSRGEYVIITSEAGAGLWVSGERSGAEFQGMVPLDSIAQISVYRFSAEKTAILGFVIMTTGFSALAAAGGRAETYSLPPIP